MKLPRHNGQAVPEYGLILGLVAVAGISALTLMGGSLNDIFGGMLSRGGGQSGAVAVAAGASSGGSAPYSASGGGASASATLGDGTKITLESIDIPASIQTAGVNGTTDKILASMIAQAEAWKESGEITEAQYNAIIDLANKGHKLAAGQAAIENALVGAANARALESTSVEFDGKTYGSVLTLSNELGVSLYDETTGQWLPGSYLKDFEDSTKSVTSALRTTDPEVAVRIESYVSAISSLADGMDNALYDVHANQSDSTESLNVLMTTAMNTHNNSAGICGTGNGADSGTQCQ